MKKQKRLNINKAKLAIEALEKEMSIISDIDELKSYLGGTLPSPPDCVVSAFDYIDGNGFDNYDMYQASMLSGLGYNNYSTGSDGSYRAVQTQDISTVGAYGGLTVTDLMSSGGGTGVSLTTGGKTLAGNDVMVTFNNGAGQDHAVVLTAVSNGYMSYYDPQNGSSGIIWGTNYSGMYEVSH